MGAHIRHCLTIVWANSVVICKVLEPCEIFLEVKSPDLPDALSFSQHEIPRKIPISLESIV